MSEEEKDLINLKIAISPEKYMRELQQENQSLKDRIEKANILTKRIKNDVFERMAECYEKEDEWNGDFLNTEINSIDRLSDLLKGDK